MYSNNNLIKLKKDIKRCKDELDFNILNNSKDEIIVRKTIELDMNVTLYTKACCFDDEENKKIFEKYENIIEKSYKNEILNKIKNDVKDIFNNTSLEELNHFCNNVYSLCSLMAHNIDEHKIVQYIMLKNNLFRYQMEQRGIHIYSLDNPNLTLKLCTKLKNKYVKIIKGKL